MCRGTQVCRNQRIGGFLNTIVDKAVGACLALDQFLTAGRPKSRVHPLLWHFQNDRKRRDLSEVSEAGQLLQCCLRLGRYANKLFNHQIYDIVGVSLGVNAVEIAVPARSIMVKGEHSFVGERKNELNGEERIATRHLVYRSASGLDRIELAHERMRGSNFVVAVRADEEKIAEIGPAQQVFHEV